MSSFDGFRYDGKRVLVVGGATGMGAAAAEIAQDAGAEVVVMDVADVTLAGAKAVKVNLADRTSIESAVDECGGHVDVLMSCAGVADGTAGIERINFIGHRHMIDRLLTAGMLGRGSNIGFISSTAGAGWEPNLPELNTFLDITDWDGAVRWIEEHDRANYTFSKQAVCAYVARQAFSLLQQGIRINAICPGPTDTPLARANFDKWLGFGTDYRDAVGRNASTAMDQAYPLVFLCSDAAYAITGVSLITDAGHLNAGLMTTFAPAAGFARHLTGR